VSVVVELTMSSRSRMLVDSKEVDGYPRNVTSKGGVMMPQSPTDVEIPSQSRRRSQVMCGTDICMYPFYRKDDCEAWDFCANVKNMKTYMGK
jgi:hypothetical protein